MPEIDIEAYRKMFEEDARKARAAEAAQQLQEGPPQQAPQSGAPLFSYTSHQVVELPIDQLHSFDAARHHFRPADPERLEALKDSIRRVGILNPLLVREQEDGEYEILAGHNRRAAARLLGYDTLPCFVRRCQSEDEATEIMLTDNLQHRENLLPSEKAWAYRDLMEIRKRKAGRPQKNSGHDGQNFDWRESEDFEDASRSVGRYVRLTYLLPVLLDKVDANALGLVVAEQVSFLSNRSQQAVYDYFFVDSPNKRLDKALAAALRQIEADPDQVVDREAIDRLVAARDGNRNFRTVKVPMKEIRHYFHVGTTQEEVERTILRAMEFYFNGGEQTEP